MEPLTRAWARRLAIALALVVGLLVAALPASAAPTTKNYSASLSFGTATGTSVTVPAGSTVGVVLTNLPDSQQSFGSAQLDFAGPPLPSGVSVSRPGWTVQELITGTRYRVVNSGTQNPVPPGSSLEVLVTMPATPSGTTSVTTSVRQSNNFLGTNNDFTLLPKTSTPTPLQIVTQPSGTPCAGTCTPTAVSPINGVRADLTVTSAEPFTFTAGFTTNRLRCDTIPFGAGVQPEPFQVETQSTSPVSKTLKLTFPKALANLVPNNGTPLHPVCAGGDFPFPGSSTDGTLSYPNEGLLLNCSDPAYAQQVSDAGTAPFLPMCVSARARSAGNLIVTITVASTTFDPSFW